MFVLANLFMALAKVCDIALTAYYWLILVRALLSWVNPDPFNPIVQFLERVTEPVLSPIRRFLPHMAIDLSPVIAFLIVMFLRSFLVQTLFDIGVSMRT
ncbi:MAG: YggT family protein [Candidatus Omnitrophica bacterium]|nr:YggT family protein [Candidatus Omnitrophota bacterium]